MMEEANAQVQLVKVLHEGQLEQNPLRLVVLVA